jgi:non-specific serine/threonine protein kinase
VVGENTRAELARQVRDALRHLHDRPRLQTHPLARFVGPGTEKRSTGRGKILQDALLAAIEAMRPDHDAPAASPAGRTYQLLVRRYVEGEEAGEVQRQLAIGKTEYYAEHQRAVEAIASWLWERWQPTGPVMPAAVEASSKPLPAAPTPVETIPGNLPAQLTSFVGREEQVAAIAELLRTARLVTLVGVGGCGKTRLALVTAERVRDAYPDGVWLVELAPLADPARLPSAIAVALGVEEQPQRPLTETLAAFLRARRLMLVLDNCEHLITACAQLTEELLRRCPTLTVLATSREALGVPGEVTRRVPSLSVSERRDQFMPPENFIADLLRTEAAQLFVDRARMVVPGFRARAENASAIAEICRRLDGIPLAIELAAARMKVLGVEEIAVRLHNRFQLLTGGSRTALPRQQTLRATLDWSYNLLSDPERAVFRRLSVFAGGFCLDAAEAVCRDKGVGSEEARSLVPSPDILDLVSQLVDKSLVQVDQQRADTRYRLLETVRQYGHERLVEAEEAVTARDRHRDWCLQLAEQAKPELIGPRQAFWLDRLETERDNLRAALAWVVERGPAEIALRLAASLWRFFFARDYLAEGWDWVTRVLAAPGALTPASSRAEVLEGASELASWLGDHAAQQHMAEESLAVNRALGDHRGAALALRHLFVPPWAAGDFVRIEEVALEALAEARNTGDSWVISQAMETVSASAWLKGDISLARHRFEECAVTWRELGDRRALQGELVALGTIACQEGDYLTAKAHFDEALAISRELRSNSRIGEALLGLGGLARLQDDNAQARTLATMGLELLKERGNRGWIGTALFQLGSAARRAGDAVEAERLVQESLATFDESRLRPFIMVAVSFCGVMAVLRAATHRGARLLAAGSLQGGHFRLLLPDDFQAHAESLAAARMVLGERDFATAWAEGQAMTLEQAVAYALNDDGPKS